MTDGLDRVAEAQTRRIVREELASLFSPQSFTNIKAELQGHVPMTKTVMRNVEIVVQAIERAMHKAWRL